MRRAGSVSAGVMGVLAMSVLAGCSGGSASGVAGASNAAVKVDGNFTLAIASDPGSLDPATSYKSSSRQVYAFLYDTLVSVADGKVLPHLASAWTESTTKATFTLKDGVTCSDGSPLTAQDVAANINYVANPKNGSPLTGLAVPLDAKATVDGETVKVTASRPTGFLVQMLSAVPIVCRKGLADRATLKTGAAGTGPYELTDAVPGDRYTFKRRSGYTWGPNGAATATPGLPASVTIKVMSNPTTVANSLLAGSVSQGSVNGADASRLKSAGLFSQTFPALWGEFIFNQAPRRPLADVAARRGMTAALDLKQLMTISTSGAGSLPTQLLGDGPCDGDSVTGNIPAYDVAAAKRALAGLSGKTLNLVYANTSMGQEGAAGSELAVSMWKAAGITVRVRALSTPELFKTVYEGGDWDVVWFPVDGDLPQQVQNSFGGPGPADGGNNFANIKNGEYDKLSSVALASPGTSGCSTWLEAERALVRNADVVPFSVRTQYLWGSHSTFGMDSTLVSPTSIRMRQ